MKFQEFFTNLQELRTTKLGGEDAQFKLAPALRSKFSELKINSFNPTQAAVMVLFYPNQKNETCFLLTLRANYNGTHSSQISFPGGKFDKKNDKNLKNTALRESFEEVGIKISYKSIFKEMTQVFIPPSNFLVTPFLCYTQNTPNFTKNYEVKELIEVTLSSLLSTSSISTTLVNTSYAKQWEVPCFNLNGYQVWGATAMMLSEIRELFQKL